MATYTSNYHMTKPQLTDAPPDITAINGNFDTIDSELASLNAKVLSANTTIYAATTGNDSSGNGTQALPFKTINKALSVIPKNLNGYTATIDIGSGTYSEVVSISNFYGGTLIVGNSSVTTTVKGINIDNSSIVILRINKINTQGTTGTTLIGLTNGSVVIQDIGLTATGASSSCIGIKAENASMFQASSVTIGQCLYVLNAESNGHIFVGSVGGTSNKTVAKVASGGNVNFNSCSISPTSLFSIAESGGEINGGK